MFTVTPDVGIVAEWFFLFLRQNLGRRSWPERRLTGILEENLGGRPLAVERAHRIRTACAPAHMARAILRPNPKTFVDEWASGSSCSCEFRNAALKRYTGFGPERNPGFRIQSKRCVPSSF